MRRLVITAVSLLALVTSSWAASASTGEKQHSASSGDASGHGDGHGATNHLSELLCMNSTVDYFTRVDNPYAYNWCIVPESSYDVVLFGGLAVVLACMLHGKLASLMVLLAGAALAGLAWPFNLRQLGNSLAIWLGINPWQLFFYIFLPPLLLDAAVRIDWYMFRKVMVQVVTMAFLVVGAGCALMVPIMLHLLRLKDSGWNWLHACMFGAIVASTDAVAIVSIMKTSGGPKRLRIILEGESLLNDASGLTLFEVFFHQVILYAQNPEAGEQPVGEVVGHVVLMVLQFGVIGFFLGYFFGWLTRAMLRVMRRFGAGRDQEVALTLAMAYLAYWITGSPCKGSGVVAVAVMGLYGAAKNKWDISVKAESEGTFDGFWETLAFIVNAMVFAYAGAATVNFFIRSSFNLYTGNEYTRRELWRTLWMLPIIYVILMVMRFVLTLAFRPLFKAIRGDLTLRDCSFLTMAGLRGAASLIMGQAVVTEVAYQTDLVVKSELVFWTAGFVLLTLLINAPLLPWVLRVTGLSAIPEKQLARRRRAVAALADHTASAIEQLRAEEEEMLTGVDWAHVQRFCDFTQKLTAFGQSLEHPKGPPLLHRLAACCGRAWGTTPRGAARGGLFGTLARKLGLAPPREPPSAAPDADLAGRGAGAQPSFSKAASFNGTSGAAAPAHDGAADGGGGLFHWPFRSGAGGLHATIEEHHEEGLGHHSDDDGGGGHEGQDGGHGHHPYRQEGIPVRVIGSGAAAPAPPQPSEAPSVSASGVSRDSLTRPSLPPGLLMEMLPVFGETRPDQIDVLQQECPLAGKTRFGLGGQGADRRRSGPSIEERKAGGAGGSAAPPPAVPPPAALPSWGMGGSGTGAGGAAVATAADGEAGVAGDAYSAALLARSARSKTVQAQAAAAAAAKPKGSLLRGLATRSASPYFVGGGPGASADGGLPSAAAAPAGASALSPPPSAPLIPSGRTALSVSGALATGGGSGHGGGAAAAGRASVAAAPLQSGALASDPTERALGRPSRGLASRSVTMASAYGGADASHASGGSPASTAAAAAPRPFGYGGGAAGGRSAGDLAGAEAGSETEAPSLRSLATRSVGMPGGGLAPPLAPVLSGEPLPRALPALSRASTGAGGAPHMAPIAPALGRISTGLAATYAGGAAGPGGAPRRGNLHAQSVPLSKLARSSRPAGAAEGGLPSRSPPLSTTSPVSVLGRRSLNDDGNGAKGADGRPSSECYEDAGHAEELADARTWLVSGLKRYFHGKRMQGLLSARALRILDFGCDTLLDDPYKPLALWEIIERDATSTWVVNTATYGLFWVRRASVWLMHPRLGRAGRVLGAPLRLLASVLQRPLNKVLLLGVEVAMEYLMGLTSSPYVHWLQASDVWGALNGEITCETVAVMQWLMDREVEAPERYSAVQSYRAAMAVLRQQQHFLENLFDSGMIDTLERSIMAAPIEAQERALELTGPVWRAPGLKAVLGQLPFLRGQASPVVSYLVKYGHLLMMASGAALPEDDCLYVVLAGIISVAYSPVLGETQEYFLGIGGVYNLYTALTGELLPGHCDVWARGNALGKGPVLFCLTASGIKNIKRLAAEGDERFAQVELDMYRLAGLLMVERMRQQFEIEAIQALTRAAPDFAAADAAGQAPLPQATPVLQRSTTTTAVGRRAAWARQQAPRVFQAVTQQLGRAELLQLGPDEAVTQHTSVLLLAGSLQCAPTFPEGCSDSGRDAVRWLCSAGKHRGQGLLPAMWEVLGREDVEAAPAHVPRRQPRVTLTAGPTGATLLVCPGPYGTVPPPESAQDPAGPAPPPTSVPVSEAGAAALLPVLHRAGSSRNLGAGLLGGGLPRGPSALDLVMMPPLAGVSGPAPIAAATPQQPVAPALQPPSPAPAPELELQPSGQAGAALLAGGVGRISEEEVRSGGGVTAATGGIGSGGGGGSRGAAAAGPSRRSFLPLEARGALCREKKLPFSSGGAGPQ